MSNLPIQNRNGTQRDNATGQPCPDAVASQQDNNPYKGVVRLLLMRSSSMPGGSNANSVPMRTRNPEVPQSRYVSHDVAHCASRFQSRDDWIPTESTRSWAIVGDLDAWCQFGRQDGGSGGRKSIGTLNPLRADGLSHSHSA